MKKRHEKKKTEKIIRKKNKKGKLKVKM